MDVRLIDATTGQVIETFTGQANGKFTSMVLVNPGVGAFQFKIQVRCNSGESTGGQVYGAAMVADQGKR